MARAPARGEIWLADLNPTRGHEQAGRRPVLVVSTDVFNQGPAGLVFVLPLTRTDRHIPLHIAVDPPEGGLTARSYILCDAIRSIAKERLSENPWGQLRPQTMQKVEDTLRILLDL
jgi:mRNA interferase MazF